MLLLADDSSKESRRAHVADKFNIIMLLGDDLGDFSAIFNNNSMEERREWVEKSDRISADSNAVLNSLLKRY
ncbi:hypothetical protein RYH73_00230 [Olivibacter sp. CPCC 100613]|uniref:hypothetical protein n=1 Tax=Olivibacter sp. CPCC 100613 TaxID=3079931 RepID=UPI002FF6FD9D